MNVQIWLHLLTCDAWSNLLLNHADNNNNGGGRKMLDITNNNFGGSGQTLTNNNQVQSAWPVSTPTKVMCGFSLLAYP